MEEEWDGELLQSHESVTLGAHGPCEPSPFRSREWGYPLLEVQLEMNKGEMAVCGIQGQSWQCFSGHGQVCPPAS